MHVYCFSSSGLPGIGEYAVIREIYENDSSSEDFENELERALESEVQTIIIEPTKLGDETARWIYVGNCLHKTAVISGIGSLVTGFTWPDKGFIYFPMGFISIVCTGVYIVSWQFDPCCKYQVESESKNLQKLPLDNLTSSSPVVLVRKNDFYRKALHTFVSFCALSYCGWRLYGWCKQ